MTEIECIKQWRILIDTPLIQEYYKKQTNQQLFCNLMLMDYSRISIFMNFLRKCRSKNNKLPLAYFSKKKIQKIWIALMLSAMLQQNFNFSYLHDVFYQWHRLVQICRYYIQVYLARLPSYYCWI